MEELNNVVAFEAKVAEGEELAELEDAKYENALAELKEDVKRIAASGECDVDFILLTILIAAMMDTIQNKREDDELAIVMMEYFSNLFPGMDALFGKIKEDESVKDFLEIIGELYDVCKEELTKD